MPQLIAARSGTTQVNGLNLDGLGTEMERDSEQLADWLAGRHRPCKRNLEVIEKFLTEKYAWQA